MNFLQFKNYILYFMLLTIGIPLEAQHYKITGMIIDNEQNLPIEQATIKLLNPKDSIMLSGTVSDPKGAFVLKQIKKGNYLLCISYIGFSSEYKTISISGKTPIVKAGTFKLKTDALLLNETIITAEAPEVVMRNDTMEYSADAYKVEEGAALEEVFKKMPGVEVDKDGKITVNGEEIKKIYIDGKEFFFNDPKMASKNLPSKMIDKIQILDKKSDMAKLTGFNDDEEQKVINLTIKPEMKKGWIGKVEGGYGNQDRYRGNLNISRFIGDDQISVVGGSNNIGNIGGNGTNLSGRGGVNFVKFKENRLQINGSANYNISKNEFIQKSRREDVLPGDSISFYNSNSKNNSKQNNLSANLRVEWTPDTMTTLIFSPHIGYGWNNNYSMRKFNTIEELNDSVNIGESFKNTNSENINFNASLLFSKRLNSKGRVFSFSFAGGAGNSDTKGKNYSFTDYLKPDAIQEDQFIDQQIQNNGKNFNYNTHISWVEPIGHQNFLQLSYTFRHNRSQSIRNSFSIDEEGNFTRLDTAYSKSFDNTFINQRIRLSFKADRKKYFYIIGIQANPAHSNGRTFVGDSTLSHIKRNVFNIAPNFMFMYKFDRRTNLRIHYSGNTSQPSIQQLQPVADLSNPLNIIQGNPNLKPTFHNNISARFHRSEPKTQRVYMANFNGNFTINEITNYSVYDASLGKRETTYKNINGNFGVSGRIRVDYPIFKKKIILRSNSGFRFNRSNTYINGKKNTNRNLVLNERAGARLKLEKFDMSAYGRVSYNQAKNSFQTKKDKHIWNYGVTGDFSWILPLKFRLESDINWMVNTGYSDGYEKKQVIWNASLQKSFLKQNRASLKFKIYDILQQRTNISRTIGSSFTQDNEFNSLTSFFIVSFNYQFNVFTSGKQS